MVDWTEGPWFPEYQNCHTGQVATCHGDGEGYWEVWSRNWFAGIDQKANAHLIAAAPELYEALAMVEPIIDEMAGTLEPGRKIRNALAKARGDQSASP